MKKVVAPIEVSTSIVSAYNVPASLNAAWVADTTCAVGNKVCIGQYDYELLADNNTRNDTTKDGGVKWMNLRTRTARCQSAARRPNR